MHVPSKHEHNILFHHPALPHHAPCSSVWALDRFRAPAPDPACASANVRWRDPPRLLPAGILSTASGLYVTDANGGTVRRITQAGTGVVATNLPRAYGLAERPDGGICVTHYTTTDPMTRLTAVSCLTNQGISALVTGVGDGLNGIAAVGNNLVVVGWNDTPTGREGQSAWIQGNTPVSRARYGEDVPQFVTALADGSLLMSLLRDDPSGFYGGQLRITSTGGRGMSSTAVGP